MKSELNILMIDDHPMILEGYKKILSRNKDHKLKIRTAVDCDSALNLINQGTLQNGFDIVFIDIQLPASSDGTITSGEDLAFEIKEKNPLSKVIILTMLDKPDRLLHILKTVPHDSLLVKSDITGSILKEAFTTVMNHEKFYSKTVQQYKNQFISKSDQLDEHDRKILFHISEGVRTKNLPNYISLSLSAIEKRKKHLKFLFDVNGDDEKLITEAKKRGFI